MKPTAIAIALTLALPALAQSVAEDALILPPLAQGFPLDGATDIPTNTLIWTHQPARLIGPDGELPLVELTRFSAPGTEVFIAADPGPLPSNTQLSVLDETGELTLATFTTGAEAAASPEAPVVLSTEAIRAGLFQPVAPNLSARIQWSGILLLVEPDADSLDELTLAEQVTETELLSFPLEARVEKRLVAVNAAGEMSEPTVLLHEEGGCAQVHSELLALWPILGLLALRRRRKER